MNENELWFLRIKAIMKGPAPVENIVKFFGYGNVPDPAKYVLFFGVTLGPVLLLVIFCYCCCGKKKTTQTKPTTSPQKEKREKMD